MKAQNIGHSNTESKTIRTKILGGYFWVTIIIIFLVVSSLFFLTVIERGYKDINNYRQQQSTAQEVIAAHYKWLDALNASILTGVAFEGGLDPNTCSLGSWLNNVDIHSMNDTEMSQALQAIIEPHKEIHASASELIDISKTDRNAAFKLYTNEVKQKVVKIGEGLAVIGNRYNAIAQEKANRMSALVVFSFVMCIILGVLAIFFSFLLGSRISKKLSDPISTVAQWSKVLAEGIDNLSLDTEAYKRANHILEIEQMILAFQEMTRSIQKNVDVIKKVASGDLTAFVDIKSEGDSLGANLYHLVQNNDMMFANLLQVADCVAENAGSIASASQVLSGKTLEQADAVEGLSNTVNKANDLAMENTKRASVAADISNSIKKEVDEGDQKMMKLLKSVNEIKEASDKVSNVMKAIDDIAFQTNILALNAAVEAARAGSAGKGFAVVADEVRNLSLKSAEAAKQSGELIENTIKKTVEGSRISQETFETFENIVKRTNEITEVVNEITSASIMQQEHIQSIHEEIGRISDVVAGNAATSEETAAATQLMNDNADLIRQEMKKFNLRKRIEGKPYIPDEKKHDEDFIREATENYLKAKKKYS